MIRGAILAVLQHRREPQGASSQFLQVVKLLPYPVDRTALKVTILAIPGQVTRWCARVIEAINHDKVYPSIPPILRGRERAWYFDALVSDLHAPGAQHSRLVNYCLDFGTPDRCRHKLSFSSDLSLPGGRLRVCYQCSPATSIDDNQEACQSSGPLLVRFFFYKAVLISPLESCILVQ